MSKNTDEHLNAFTSAVRARVRKVKDAAIFAELPAEHWGNRFQALAGFTESDFEPDQDAAVDIAATAYLWAWSLEREGVASTFERVAASSRPTVAAGDDE